MLYSVKLSMVQNAGNVQSEIKLHIAQRMPKLIALNFNEEMLDFCSTGIAGSKLILVKTGEKINRATNMEFIHLNGCNKTWLQWTKKKLSVFQRLHASALTTCIPKLL